MKTVRVRPRFSVVIPTLDSAEWISRCIVAVLSQTFSSLELVLVDAGSTDGTLDAVHSLADSRVRVITSKATSPRNAAGTGHAAPGGDASGHAVSGNNVGPTIDRLAAARSHGFGACRGEWSTTLDPTDNVDPTWLSRLGKLADRSGASFISCGGEQRFSDLSHAAISPVPVPEREGVSACLRSGSFAARTSYFRALSPESPSDIVATGIAVLSAVIADGRSCASTPESLLHWYEGIPAATPGSREELELSWAMQALDALSRSPIPDGELLARYATLGAEAAMRLGHRHDARKLFAVARNALPTVPRHWVSWAGSLVPVRFG